MVIGDGLFQLRARERESARLELSDVLLFLFLLFLFFLLAPPGSKSQVQELGLCALLHFLDFQADFDLVPQRTSPNDLAGNLGEALLLVRLGDLNAEGVALAEGMPDVENQADSLPGDVIDHRLLEVGLRIVDFHQVDGNQALEPKILPLVFFHGGSTLT